MSNLTNISYLNSLLLANIRSTYLTDALYLYLMVPMAIIGTILNIINIFILTKKTFSNINIYKIMIVYSLNSFIISFITIFSGLFFNPHILFYLSISEIGRIYTCYISTLVIPSFYFYGNCLDILMNLDRALSFSNKYQKLKQTSPYLICFIVLIICKIIHLPSDFSRNHVPNDQLYVTLRLCSITQFATASLTQTILIVSYIIEGPIVMILEIGSNLLAYISYKSYMNRKEQLAINNNNNNRSTELTESEKRKQAKTEKMNQKLLMMSVYLTLFSILSHIIQFGSQLILVIFNSYVSKLVFAWVFFISSYVIVFKHFFTIIFYYKFNLNFKRTLLSFICKNNKENNRTVTVINNNIQLKEITRQNTL